MASLHRLHRLQQGLFQGFLPFTTHRHDGGHYSGPRTIELHGRILRLQPNLNASGRPRKNFFYHGARHVLLQSDAFWSKKCRGNYARTDHGGLHRRHAGKIINSGSAPRPSRQSFDIINKYGMKLNPTKCSFGVSSGKFLGNLVTKRGVEANPDQLQSIMNLRSPKSIKDIQKLTGRLATLNRFISKSFEKHKPFFDALKKSKSFDWNQTSEDAFQNIKRYLADPPLLSKPKEGETLLLYLAVSETAVSAVLVREEDGKQLPEYYISKTLLNAETRYTQLEKLALALVTAARKLRSYFQCHTISVLTIFPLKNVLHKPELS
ncbi:hypothetical protein ACOSQ2_010260 [Xanthoceras sorbifolium]